MSTQHSPKGHLNTGYYKTAHYSSDSALNVTHQTESGDHDYNVTKRQKRTFDDLGDETNSTLKVIKGLFAEFKEQQDLKFDSLTATLNTIITQNKDIQNTVELLNTRHDELLLKYNNLEQENIEIKQRMTSLETKLEHLEKNACSSTLEVRNLPKQVNENKKTLFGIMQSLGTTIGLDTPLQSCDVKNIYRSKSNSIVAEFSATLRKEEIITKYRTYNKKQRLEKKPLLNTSNISTLDLGNPLPIFISEFLTSKVRRIFYFAREQVKNKTLIAAWTSFGRVYVRKEDGSPSVRIEDESDLDKLII